MLDVYAGFETAGLCLDAEGRGGRDSPAGACIPASEAANQLTSAPKRDTAFRRFKDLYSIRSDISHGRVHTISPEIKTEKLMQLEVVVRELWDVILQSPKTRDALEGDDERRKAYFENLQLGWNAPDSQK